LIYLDELEEKDTIESDKYASYLDILLNINSKGRLTSTLYDKCDDFHFAIVNFPFRCTSSNIPLSPANDVYIYQLIQYARADVMCMRTFQSKTNCLEKFMLQGDNEFRLMSSFRKFHNRYNDHVCDYKLLLAHMLYDLFHTLS
jgi:hypothetical protein